MAFPFPDDRTALARLDWCRAGEPDDYDGLSCALRARMCGAHVQASGNPAWASLSGPAFSELLAAAHVEQWSPCPEGKVSGACGLLFTDRYGPALWKEFGHERETRLYTDILSGSPSEPPAAEAKALPACAFPAALREKISAKKK
jgi:hypothetical protein